MTHHAECLAQASLFDEAGPCTCPKGWPRKTAPKVSNPCFGASLDTVEIPATHWGVRLPFTPSVQQLGAYATSQKHRAPSKRNAEGDSRDTFDDEAVRKLRAKYPADPLYPKLEGYRILQKALGTYVEKLRASKLIGADGRLRDAYRHTPKTLRLAMELLQVLPRPLRGEVAQDDPRRVYDAIRKCFIPTEGHAFVALDFSGIEPLMVAYLARDAQYLRACRLGSHSWFTSFVVGQPVAMAGSDEDVLAALEDRAKGGPYLVNGTLQPWKLLRDGCKTTHMASLYGGGPGEIARANPDLFSSKSIAARYQAALFELIPSLPRWHWDTAETAERQGYLLAPSGFRLHAFGLFDYDHDAKAGKWVRKLSRTAKEVIAALPQHLGMMYLATAAESFAAEFPDLAQWVRLLIHDEILGEPPLAQQGAFTAALQSVMERPHPLMPLWSEAQAVMNGDTHLRVRIETKASPLSWGTMK